MADKNNISLIQPYLLLNADRYRRICRNGTGISEFYEFTIPDNGQSQFYAVPDGSVDIVFGISENDVRVMIGGTVLKVKKWEFSAGRNYFGIRFQPGQYLLPKGLDVCEVVNNDLDFSMDVYSNELAEKIAMKKTIKERADVFMDFYTENFLESHDNMHNIERYVRRRIYETKGNISIKELCSETGYSECYLRRSFEQVHGISPKLFERFIRFQHMLNCLENSSGSERTDELAVICGYYDQSHMMKDFKQFSGRTPDEYRRLFSNKTLNNK